MPRRPGTPRLIREINDRAALDLMLEVGPLTKTRLGELTGLSKVTAAQMLGRLEERRLVEVVGTLEGGRGPNAALYGVVPSSGYVAGLHVGPDVVTTAVADITGEVVAEVSVDPREAADPVSVIRRGVTKATRRAGVAKTRLRCLVIGSPGIVDAGTGDLRFAYDLPEWHLGLLRALRTDFRRPVVIENDVNLAALAERSAGAARGVDDFVLVWVGRGLGLAAVLDGRLHRGVSGGAGEIGYLPVPDEPLPKGMRNPRHSGFQSLVGADGVRRLARAHGIRRRSAVACIEAALGEPERGGVLLDELAHRLAIGLSSVCVVLDPGLCVLSGEIAVAGGAVLAHRVEAALAEICPNPTRVVASDVEGDPVLRGTVLLGLEAARDEVFSQS
ncbi:MAG TPA: ROK family transcriptional regulator [Nocardioidaceae bacterium]|nr:ROK family transcriptional regulator [Nocardioidaceae bacterium]